MTRLSKGTLKGLSSGLNLTCLKVEVSFRLQDKYECEANQVYGLLLQVV